jgi:hypothetical protein
MATAFSKQPQNRNFLSPIGFKFTLARYPKVAFFCNSARIPEITLNVLTQDNYLNDIPQPGGKMTFGDLNINFLVDESMENYMVIHNWITAYGGSGSLAEYGTLITDQNGTQNTVNGFSDGSLYVLNSNYASTAVVKFKDLFPISLSSLEFDSKVPDIQYFTSQVTFKYTIYDILGTDNQPLYPFTST